ncbi:MAG TPA: ionic transporter y4hA [Sphingomicrobium sp.]|nr:ionic transporter y4hA [Sphingomicrobium sp.]
MRVAERAFRAVVPNWSRWMPGIGIAVLLLRPINFGNAGIVGASTVLVGCVLVSVHHAEVVAHKVGEPFGTLILAVAVTVIEASLILSMMLSGAANPALPRDTVFAAIMLILNGVVGACMLVGGVRHREQRFVLEGVNAGLCVLAAMATLVLVLPTVAASRSSSEYTPGQLVFTALASLTLYATFVFVQTIRHRDYFLPDGGGDLHPEEHAAPPTGRQAVISLFLLLLALVSVVLLAKTLSHPIEQAIVAAALPRTFVGIVIAALVLAPESLAALQAARRNRLQTSLNLALGSALATIGLTIPTVAITALLVRWPLSLGLDARGITLLAVSLVVAILSFGTGRTTILQGAVHLVLLAAYIFTSINP